MVAHNAEFERSFLPALRNERWLCTYRLARHLWREAPRHQLQVLRYELKLNVRADQPHRAADDVKVVSALLFRELEEYAKRHLPWTLPDVMKFANRPLPPKHPHMRLVASA